MKDLDADPKGFDALRHAGIAAAQQASRDHWTDYNLHDPGVTLLEQTCFALTEVAFRARHDVRDLLTDENGHLAYDALGLFLPERTLPGAPVTLLDLAAALGEVPGVARAILSPGLRKGLIDVVIIPAQGRDTTLSAAARSDLETRVRQQFHRDRPLACDLGHLTIAVRRRTRLEGVVQITATAVPDKVAAALFYRVSAILRGVPVGSEIGAAATRAMVYDKPQTFLHAPSDQDGRHPKLENHLTSLRDIPGVVDLSDIELIGDAAGDPTDESTTGSSDTASGDSDPASDPTYLDLLLPAPDRPLDLRLEVGGVPVPLDANRIVDEYIRIAADSISQAKHHLDATDWQPPPPGTRRGFDSGDVDALLPQVFQAVSRRDRTDQPFKAYRRMANEHLAAQNRDLSDLQDRFSITSDTIPDDPAAQRRAIEVLDYQLALQSVTMPATRHTGMHLYRSAAERYRFEVSWRLEFLRQLPELNARRGTAPFGSEKGGFLSMFCWLADLVDGQFPKRPASYDRLGLQLADDATLPAANFAPPEMDSLDRTYRLLTPRRIHAARVDAEALRSAFPWLGKTAITPAYLARLADPGRYMVATQSEDTADTNQKQTHTVFFEDADDRGFHRCGDFEHEEEAHRFANALRYTWRDLHARAEGCILVEDVLLRAAATEFTPGFAYLIMPGWTARMMQGSFRAYIKGLIEELAPAHLYIKPLWLDFTACEEFAALYASFDSLTGAGGDDLRQFLRQQGEPDA